MKFTFAALLLALGVAGVPAAHAAGCLKGAAVGGVAGHMAGHGGLGAAAGCAVGHHEANKGNQQQAPAATNGNTNPGSNSSK